MRKFMIKVLVMMVAIYLVGKFTNLYYIGNWIPALFAAFVLAIANAIVRPIIILLTLPVTIVTLGIFLLFINGLMLMLAAAIVPSFQTYGWFSSTLAALIITIISAVINSLIKPREQ